MFEYKKYISLLLTVIMIFALSSCSDESNNATVYFELLEKPDSIDPQIAYTDSELIIVRNLFEGLMRKDEKGNTVEGACESYEKNGLTYRFKLRKGLKWSDGSDVLAEDFVFGIKRALLKDTNSPFANRLFAIKNAKEVHSGTSDVSNLGISGKGDTVVIKLGYDDDRFLEALTTSVAMPCKEKYFLKTEGKYGQDANSIICNGSYDIYKWNKEEFGIRLYNNKEYSGAYPAKNGAVFFSLVEDEKQVNRLKDKESDIAFLPSPEIKEAKQSSINVASVENICWFLTIGDEYDSGMKSGFLSAFSGDVYSSVLGEGMRAADSIYPEILGMSGAEGVGMPDYDLQNAVSSFSSSLKNYENQVFPSSVLYYYGKEEIKEPVTTLLGHWQQNLCAFINIKESANLSKLQEELNGRSLQFAVFPVTAHSASLSEYLGLLNISGDGVTAQRNLLSSGNIVPLCFETTNIGYTSDVSGVYCDNGNGYIDFSYILKDK